MTSDERNKIHNEANSYCDEEIISQDENGTKSKYWLHINVSKYECLALYVNHSGLIELELKNELGIKYNIKITLDKFKEIFIKNTLF